MILLSIRQGQGYVAKIGPDGLIDGKGVRYSAYVLRCPFNCVGCYSKILRRFRYDEKYTDGILAEILDGCDRDYIFGLSLLGGEPFCNLGVTLNLIKAFRARSGNTKTIWVRTGFLYEYLANGCTGHRELLPYIDVLVDSLFIQHLFKPDLPYKGSSDQRITNIQQSPSYTRMTKYIVS